MIFGLCLAGCSASGVLALTPVDRAESAPTKGSSPKVWASDYSAHVDVLAVGYDDGSFEVRCPAPAHVLSRGKHAAGVVNLALSPDGQRLVTVDESGVVALSEIQSGELKLLPQAPGADVGARTNAGLAWDGSGKRLAISSGDFVRVVDVDTGESRRTEVTSGATAVAFWPNGTELAVGGSRLAFLSLPDLKEKRHLSLPQQSGSDGSLDVRYSADGRWLGVLLHAGVAVVDLGSGEVQSAFSVETPPEGIRFAKDGRMAVFGRSSLYVGPVTTNDLATATRKTGGTLWDVEFRQDGSLLFLGEGLDADLEANLQ